MTRKQVIAEVTERMKRERPEMAQQLAVWQRHVNRLSDAYPDDGEFWAQAERMKLYLEMMTAKADAAGARPDQTLNEVLSKEEQRTIWSFASQSWPTRRM